MKLLKCYINNFGKLSDFTYIFDENITVVNEQNGFGKSTFCAFIKAMFFGFNNTKSKNISDNERLRYTPWQGGLFGGYIDFLSDDKEYRIERAFGKKPSQDEFNLYDLKTGLKSDDFTDKIGEELFGIDLKGFERCIYFSNIQVNSKMPISISAKMSSLIDNTDDLCNYDTAMNALVKRSRQYQTIGNKGIISETKLKLSEFQNQLCDISKDIQSLSEKEKQLRALKENKHMKEKELENIRSLISENAEVSVIEQKIKHYNSLVLRCKNAEERIQSLENKYVNELPSENQISELSRLYDKYESLNNNSANKAKRVIFSLTTAAFWIISSVLFLLSVLFEDMPNIFSGIFFTVLILNAAADIAVFILKCRKNSERKKIYNELQDKLSSIIKNINSKDDFSHIIKDLRNDYYDYKALKQEYKEYYDFARGYYKQENLKSFKENIRLKTPDELKKKEAEIIESINNISEQIIFISSEIKELNLKCEKYFEIQQAYQKTSEKLDEYTENYQAVLKAIELLKSAKENLSLKYKEKMQNSFKEQLGVLSDIKLLDDVMLSTELDVSLVDKGILRDIDSFSSGIKTIVEIAMRLSLIDAVFEKEKPFIILDDPFNTIDDKTFENISEKLKSLSKTIQILYFTCSKSRTF